MWRRPIEALVRKLDQVEGCPTARNRWRPRKTIRKTIKRDLDVNDLNINMIYDRIL